MPLSPLKRREVIRRLQALGFDGPHPGGKHQYMVRGSLKIRVPNLHGTKDVGIPILKQILTHLGVSEEEWQDL